MNDRDWDEVGFGSGIMSIADPFYLFVGWCILKRTSSS